MPYVYVAEAAGARILRYGDVSTRLDSGGAPQAYKLRVETWDLEPSGEVGDNVFRSIDVKVRHVNGYSVTVTPIVNGVADQPQSFSGGPPPGGLLEEYVEVQAPIAIRGTKIAAIVEVDSAAGEQDVVNVSASGVPLRRVP